MTTTSEAPAADADTLELTILMPCLNEAETLGICIEKAMKSLESNDLRGEVLIADNGSTDGSQEIATSLGARVVHVPRKGYGAALIGGIAAAKGRYVKKITVSTTTGPGIPVDPNRTRNLLVADEETD